MSAFAGYGRVGSYVGAALAGTKDPRVIIETGQRAIEQARRDGAEVIEVNAAQSDVLAAANPTQARRLIVTIPEAFEADQVVEQARAAHPSLEILARAHSDAVMEHLTGLGATWSSPASARLPSGCWTESARQVPEPIVFAAIVA